MKKSREFDNILDECLERLLVKGETIEQCLQSFPEYAAELKPLLETALAAKQASAVQPHPEVRERYRYQFHSALQETKRKRRLPIWDWQPKWTTVLAVALTLLLAGGGTAAAASNSMPDEPLYPIKIATEQLQLMFTTSALSKAELYAKLADRRVFEIAHMASQDKPDQIERTARRLNANLTKIAVLAERDRGATMMIPAYEKAPFAPPTKDRGVGYARAERRARLKTMMMGDTSGHSARLRALLETAPPSARPALLRAIAISETGYEEIIESWDEPK